MNGNGRVEPTRPWVVLPLAVAFACGAVGLARAQEEPPEGVIVDSSGLWWSEPMGDPFTEPLTWAEAGLAAESLALGGYDDWRLPTVSELLDACEDGTLPAWLEAAGDNWVSWDWELDRWLNVHWVPFGGGNFWSCERVPNKKDAWMVSVFIDHYEIEWWWWEWSATYSSPTFPGSAFFVRGGPANHGNKPRKK